MGMSPLIRDLRQKIGHDLLLLSCVPGVVFNDAGEVLLVQSHELAQYAPVGGMIEVGEEPADAVVREVHEETGVDVVAERLAGVFDGPAVTYRNGDRVHCVTIVFRCRAIGGMNPRANDDETTEARYFPMNALPPMRADHRRNVDVAARNEPAAVFLHRGR
jgi:ADP-ribose pyrophosphatase YjhB (NUDIX family)